MVLLNISQVIEKDLQFDEAIRACKLQRTLTKQRLHYFVTKEEKRRKKVVLGVHSSTTGSREGMVLMVADGDDTATSPLTSSSSTGATVTTAAAFERGTRQRRSRRSPRQANGVKLDAKIASDDLNNRYSLAVKEATLLFSRPDRKLETADEIIL